MVDFLLLLHCILMISFQQQIILLQLLKIPCIYEIALYLLIVLFFLSILPPKKWCAQRDSNPHLSLRRRLLYPAELWAHYTLHILTHKILICKEKKEKNFHSFLSIKFYDYLSIMNFFIIIIPTPNTVIMIIPTIIGVP